jgi:hypothetical protein
MCCRREERKSFIHQCLAGAIVWLCFVCLTGSFAHALTVSNNPGDPLYCQPQEGTTFLIVNGGGGVFTADGDCYNRNISNDTQTTITTSQGGTLTGTVSSDSMNYVYTPPTPNFTGLDTFSINVTTVWNGAGGTGSAGGTSSPGGAATLTITLNVIPATVSLQATSGVGSLIPIPAGSVSSCSVVGNPGIGPVAGVVYGCVVGVVKGSVSPSHGTLITSGKTIQYTPTAGYSGTDTFTYEAYGVDDDGTSALRSGEVTVNVTVTATTTTTLEVNNASPSYGDTIAGTVSVSPSTATGTVNLVLDGTTATTCTLSSGSCTWSLSGVAIGAHTLYASYLGDSGDGASNSSNTALNVSVPAATTMLNVSDPSVSYGDVITGTVQVSPSTATGTVNLMLDGAVAATCTLSSGSCTWTLSGVALGSHTLYASYQGDSNAGASNSSSEALTVENADFTVVGTAASSSGGTGSSQTATSGGSAAYTISIAPASGATFDVPVTLSVSGMPEGATAAITPTAWAQQTSTTWSLPANTALNNIKLSIQLPSELAHRSEPSQPMRKLPLLLSILLLPLAGRMRRAGKRLGRMGCWLLLLAATATALVGLSGCGSSTNGYFSQAQKSYTVIVTATAGSVSHSTSVTLTVQ